DETYPLWAVGFLRTGDWNPHSFGNPSLLPELLAAEFWLAGQLGSLAGLLATPATLIAGPDLSAAFLLARVTSALCGTLTVWGIYGLGRTLLDRRAALVGALFLALN